MSPDAVVLVELSRLKRGVSSGDEIETVERTLASSDCSLATSMAVKRRHIPRFVVSFLSGSRLDTAMNSRRSDTSFSNVTIWCNTLSTEEFSHGWSMTSSEQMLAQELDAAKTFASLFSVAPVETGKSATAQTLYCVTSSRAPASRGGGGTAQGPPATPNKTGGAISRNRAFGVAALLALLGAADAACKGTGAAAEEQEDPATVGGASAGSATRTPFLWRSAVTPHPMRPAQRP
mmetsp:Transcript_109125/g.307645  ORF Transcript_109125/g.307645 Transcript_109125/m.307645 type:complete len:234 (+) Transcript_109125:546-1247(+)